MPQVYDMGPTALAEDFFALNNPTASAGFEPANLGTKGQHATPRPPKPLSCWLFKKKSITMRGNTNVKLTC